MQNVHTFSNIEAKQVLFRWVHKGLIIIVGRRGNEFTRSPLFPGAWKLINLPSRLGQQVTTAIMALMAWIQYTAMQCRMAIRFCLQTTYAIHGMRRDGSALGVYQWLRERAKGALLSRHNGRVKITGRARKENLWSGRFISQSLSWGLSWRLASRVFIRESVPKVRLRALTPRTYNLFPWYFFIHEQQYRG